MNIITENEIFAVLNEICNKKAAPVSLPLVKRGDITQEQYNELIAKLNIKYNCNIDGNDLPINDIAEKINETTGINDYTVASFIEEICSANYDADAIIFDSVHYSYRKLTEMYKNIAANLYQKGLRKGDRMALILSNRIEYILMYFALFQIGAYPVPINTRWGKQEIFNVLSDSEASFIITEKQIGSHPYFEYVRDYCKQNECVKYVYCFEDDETDGDKFRAYDELLAEINETPEYENISPDDVAMLSYTSGTTGMPKGVMLKQNDIVKISAYTSCTWVKADNEFPFSIAPLYSAQGFLSLFIDFSLGNTFKMSSSFNPNDILKEISKCENTIVHTQPTMWSLLLNCRIINFTKFDSLQKLVVSGSLCSPELSKQIENKIGCTLLNAYGLIESTSVATMTRLSDSYDVRMNTVGHVIPGVKIKIVDENRNEVPVGEIGELAVKGYVMQGYYHNPEKTAEVIDEDGWLYTGDLAKYYDEENISIVGRCKDMIIRGGFNVYPSDIEEYLLQISGVQNAAVVGREHPVLGEEIVAFVLPKAGVSLSKNDIIKGLFNKLANYKMPDKIYFISEMPTILAGKIDKKELSKWAKEGIPEDKQILFNSNKEAKK